MERIKIDFERHADDRPQRRLFLWRFGNGWFAGVHVGGVTYAVRVWGDWLRTAYNRDFHRRMRGA